MSNAPLRVMYLTPYYRPYLGGIERAIEELSHQIQRSPDVEAVGVLTTKYSFPRRAQPGWPDRETLPDGVEVFRLPGFPRWSLPLYSVPLVWFSPRRVRQYLDEFRPNVIHFVGDGWFWGHYWAKLLAPKFPLTEGEGRPRFVFTPSFHSPALLALVAGPHQRHAVPPGGRHRGPDAAGSAGTAPRLPGPEPQGEHHRLGRSAARSGHNRDGPLRFRLGAYGQGAYPPAGTSGLGQRLRHHPADHPVRGPPGPPQGADVAAGGVP